MYVFFLFFLNEKEKVKKHSLYKQTISSFHSMRLFFICHLSRPTETIIDLPPVKPSS
ncbi:hypothetical protein Hanom_Chr16g01515261 [Helianthus anomalus]